MFLSLWKSNVWKNSKKKAAKKKTAATKTGEHVGKKAGDKIVKMLSKSGESKKVPNAPKTVTFNGNVTVKTISREKNDLSRDKSKSESEKKMKNYIIIKIK